MRLGTVRVQEALGSAVPVSEKEIQEALWHYYYDVDKSVTYLKSKHGHCNASLCVHLGENAHAHPDKFAPKSVQPKKQKPVSKFDQAAQALSKRSSKQTFFLC
jgi:elongation factor 1 alpha-like protein